MKSRRSCFYMYFIYSNLTLVEMIFKSLYYFFVGLLNVRVVTDSKFIEIIPVKPFTECFRKYYIVITKNKFFWWLSFARFLVLSTNGIKVARQKEMFS